MRSIRKLALLGLAALLVCAAVASSASAGLHTGSATGTVVASGTNIVANSTDTVLTGSFNSQVKCANSSTTVTSTNYSPDPISGSGTALSFSNCTLASDGSTCTVMVTGVGTTSPNTPMTGTLDATGVGVGTLKMNMTSSQYVTVTCSLFGSPQTCHYTTPTAGVSGAWSETASADTVFFNGVTLSLSTAGGSNSGTCSSSSTWTGHYNTTTRYFLNTV